VVNDSVNSHQITAKSNSNLAAAFFLLPKSKRKAMTALYAFCRKVDDVVDNDTHSFSKRSDILETWRNDIDKVCSGRYSKNQICNELITYIDQYELTFDLFDELIVGMSTDLEKVRYADYKELELYCYRAASVVGLLTVRILGFKNGDADVYAKNIGQALQLTNILRDVAEDAERGRIYIPQSLLEKHGVTESSILNGKQSSNFENAARELADRAWAHYKLSSEAIPKVNSRDLLVLEAMATIYWNLLQKMQKINFNVISDQRSKIRLGKLAKLALCVQTRFFIRFNGYRPVYAR
tara:strand:+ start:778 stop:1662 length:885 start_codon:yes stop_codon:yes gene_type:complete